MEKFKNAVEGYKKQAKFPTWSGLLCYLGLGSYEMEWVKQYASEGKQKFVEIARVLDMYKLELEAKFEEMLIYQDKHPELSGNKQYNYKNLQFMLVAGNPRKYGGGGRSVLAAGAKQGNMSMLGKNESGVNLLDTNKVS